MAFHHFDSPETMARLLANFLKPNGSLIITDITAREDGKHIGGREEMDLAAVPHSKGFSQDRVREIFEGAGLEGFTLEDAGEFTWQGHTSSLFVACGIKGTDV
jgi:hypothetical protein